MTDRATSARATLDAWREQRADRRDPLRFHVMDALERRASKHEGEARRMLEEKLAALIEAYAADLANADGRTAPTPASDMLAGLIAHAANAAAKRDQVFAARNASAPSASYPTLDMLDEFKKIWSTVRASSQLRQSLEQAPENAGPLNSAALVHRSIGLMRELSPGYLQQFLSYVDALAWIEQINGHALPSLDAPRATAGRKRARSRSRAATKTDD